MTTGEQKPTIESGAALELGGLVQYADGAVVSRTLIGSGAGTVTLFAFDKGQGLSEHTAPFDALAQVVDGEGDFRIGDKTSRVRAGEIILMPAGIPHALFAVERFKMLLIMLRN